MSVSYISLMWFDISRRLIPRPYIPKVFFSRLSAKIVSRFLMSCGSKLDRHHGESLYRLYPQRSESVCWTCRYADCRWSAGLRPYGSPSLPPARLPKTSSLREQKLRSCHKVIHRCVTAPAPCPSWTQNQNCSLILIITMSKIILLFIILDTVYFTVS